MIWSWFDGFSIYIYPVRLGREYSRRAKAYGETDIVVYGGMYVPLIMIPSGPDSLFAPVGTGGKSRRLSLMTLCSTGNFKRA